ncbi:hypothetical protein BOW53_15420 [Solemya pervernicosa gill symbiont]|uniref:Uncharacterized protein n=2 Tax=Gammaproteobacteria incertae sedis TaxID=118884 RepID=A0A1T2L047_9GAMM|nr:hypothetical protein [Candidatus Reidiella endopervernicosa]OOZ38487.1 hypothetical protein BOW53_15420 [Solemya pervernicosa gill symbiont]QKQ26560.1 UTP--glucose-1-phosphate uridylyltransferase [Candidatus Reidiella endopervernicosa]
MDSPPENEQTIDRVVIIFLFVLFLLISPLRDIWAADDNPWYVPYLIWLAIIFFAYRLQRRMRRDDL